MLSDVWDLSVPTLDYRFDHLTIRIIIIIIIIIIILLLLIMLLLLLMLCVCVWDRSRPWVKTSSMPSLNISTSLRRTISHVHTRTVTESAWVRVVSRVFYFLLPKMARILQENKTTFSQYLAKASLPWHPVNSNVYKQTTRHIFYIYENKNKIQVRTM